jgi:drug/metabolite transporter (DMT)-like permease
LGSSLSYAFAVHYNKRYLAHLPPVSASAGTLLMACLLMLAPALWLGPQPAIAIGLPATSNASWREVPVQAWLALGFLAFACTGAAYVVFFRLIERIGASRALTVTFMIPAFGMLWGALFLHEHISPQMILSAGIILLGTWLSNQASTPAVLRWRVARN